MWNPDWVGDENKLQEICAALAAGRVVQIRSAVNHDVASALQQELLGLSSRPDLCLLSYLIGLVADFGAVLDRCCRVGVDGERTNPTPVRGSR